ncbi:hypothetical protein QYF36_016049 [Acer negundo]|nr:hypothetical protein QYF36_016049 [Acer negundo]
MAGEGTTLEYTPTWVVALVLKKNDQKPLFEALLKIKEELMLLGFISLLLTVFQNSIAKFCISEDLASKWLPCKKDKSPNTITTTHFDRFLAESSASADYCTANGKVPLLSLTALHHLHIFIFVLAVVHVTFCALTILFGGAKIRKWKRWEDSASKGEYDLQEGQSSRYTHVQDHDFIKHRFQGLGKSYSLLGWLHSFFKQFYGSVTKSDYTTLRLGFIMLVSLVVRLPVLVAECLWLAYIFLDSIHSLRCKCPNISPVLNNIYCSCFLENKLHIFYLLLQLLLAVGTKLEHIINQLAHEVAEKHVAVEGDLVVQPSDDHFWFQRPKIIILLIHIILFQNSFELAFFFWIWVQYGFDSCIMGQVSFIIPRLLIGVFIQFLCSYSTLPLYAIVTQMGTSFKKAIFDEHIQDGLVGWARMAKRNKAKNTANGSSHKGSNKQDSSAVIQFAKVAVK